MPITPIQKAKPLREQVVESIRDALLHGRFLPGERITEEGVAEMLGVSRTPVREALSLLLRNGILESRPGGGYFVPALEEQDIEDFIEVRRLLEPAAAARAVDGARSSGHERLREIVAAEKRVMSAPDPTEFLLLTDGYWRALWALGGNEGLARSLANLVDQYHFQFVALLALRDERIRARVIELQELLIEALITGDREAAADIVSRHLEVKREALLEALAEARRDAVTASRAANRS